MNYRHVYHAGNFSDVFKHSILVLLLENLLRKEKPFCYVDTHAGLGVYNLQSPAAQKTLEYLSGISRVLNWAENDIPVEIAPYLAAIKKLNNVNFYPGSPFIARSLLRPQDRMVLMELHPEDVLSLKNVFVNDKQVGVHHYDGYQGLKAFLPPHERRGLVLIDPAFEQKNEFDLVLLALENALLRWQTGIYAIWYPIKDLALVANFLHSLSKMDLQCLVCEMIIDKQTVLKEFIGCGMVIINPPWQIEIVLKRVLSWLWRVLAVNFAGGVKVTRRFHNLNR
jgi:23S rRNA (adenine2030-N6)-methyltransferase